MRAASIGLSLLVAACNASEPSASRHPRQQPIEKGVGGDESITLTVWDQDVRAAQQAEITTLNHRFEKKYPNVTIERTARSFFDLKSRLQQAISGGTLPDVIQVNQGYADMGQLVRSGLLRPLDGYARLYNWRHRYARSLLDFNSFSQDGRGFGVGSLFGLSQEGEIVGVYYNKVKLRSLNLKIPKTLAQFESALRTAKSKGEIPIQFGNLDKFPGIHEFQALQDQFTPEGRLRDLILGRSNASFETRQNLLAASKLQSWVKKDYFPSDFDSTGYNDSWERFTRGQGLFLITGTWLSGDLDRRMPGKVGFFLMPPLSRDRPAVATGGEGLAFAVTSQSHHPNAAAAYIDFLTGRVAARVIVRSGGLPAMSFATPSVPANRSLHDIFEAWATISQRNGLVPYLDYATPTFYAVVTSGVQNLMSGLDGPRDFLKALQENYSTFQALK